MSATPGLTSAFQLAVAFHDTFSTVVSRDPDMRSKFNASMSRDEQRLGTILANNYKAKVSEELETAVLSCQKIAPVSEPAAKAALLLAEYTAMHAWLTFTEDEILKIVPERARSIRVSEFLAANDAPALGRLFTPIAP